MPLTYGWEQYKVLTDFARFMASSPVLALSNDTPVAVTEHDDHEGAPYTRMTFGGIGYDLFYVPGGERLAPRLSKSVVPEFSGKSHESVSLSRALLIADVVQRDVFNMERALMHVDDLVEDVAAFVQKPDTFFDTRQIQWVQAKRREAARDLERAQEQLKQASDDAPESIKPALPRQELLAAVEWHVDNFFFTVEDYEHDDWREVIGEKAKLAEDWLTEALNEIKETKKVTTMPPLARKAWRLLEAVRAEGSEIAFRQLIHKRRYANLLAYHADLNDARRKGDNAFTDALMLIAFGHFRDWAAEKGYVAVESAAPENVAYSAATGEELVWRTPFGDGGSVQAYPASADVPSRYELRKNPPDLMMPLGAWLALGWWMQRRPVKHPGSTTIEVSVHANLGNLLEVLDALEAVSGEEIEFRTVEQFAEAKPRYGTYHIIAKNQPRDEVINLPGRPPFRLQYRPVLTYEGYTVYERV